MPRSAPHRMVMSPLRRFSARMFHVKHSRAENEQMFHVKHALDIPSGPS
jgi:hypothetical protein